jgi:hypothetical protein
MSVIAAISSNLIRRTRNSVRPLQILHLPTLTICREAHVGQSRQSSRERNRGPPLNFHRTSTGLLDQATVTTEITALQILDDVGIISANIGTISSQLDGVATQLKWVSNHVLDAGMYS